MKYLFALGGIVLLFYGCCGKVDCMSISGFGVRILDKHDSTNLFFCINKKYNLKDVLVYTKNGYLIDTIKPYVSYNHNFSSNATIINNCDSLVVIVPSSYTNKFYIKYSAIDIDSFNFKQRVVKSGCCPNQTELYDLEFRGNIVQLDFSYNYTIYK